MSPRLDFGGRSDVGMQRQDNQDSLYAGPRLLAVADGVGGAAHGEIASRVTITAVSALETEQIDDADTALRRAAGDADTAIRSLVAGNAELSGMSTTLTAVLATDDRLTLAHIGDSRAYLLRAGRLVQLTNDHTLVQSLIDDGQITEEQALTHPRRSWILRALDGRGSPEVDVSTIDAEPGDRLLVCSDGLSSYVEETAIARTLAGDDPQTAASRLVDLALQAGGSDNISCAVADIADNDGADRPPIVAGAVAEPEPAILQTPASPELTAPAEPVVRTTHAAPRQRSIGRRLAVVASLVVILIAAGVVITTVYVHHQWYVAPEAGKVAVFQGVQGNAAGVKLSHRKVLTDIPVTALPQDDRERVVNGIDATGGQAGASQVVANLRSDACNLATATAAPLTPTSAKPSATPSLTGKPKDHLPHATHTSPPPTPTWCTTP